MVRDMEEQGERGVLEPSEEDFRVEERWRLSDAILTFWRRTLSILLGNIMRKALFFLFYIKN